MEHLNYSRQLANDCLKGLKEKGVTTAGKVIAENIIRLHSDSIKFLLPDGGRPHDDKELRALDESIPIRLPYPCIAIEYKTNGIERCINEPVGWIDGEPYFEDVDSISAPKRVFYAREDGNWIVITVAFFGGIVGQWRILPECAIPTVGYLKRNLVSPSGRPAITTIFKNENIPKSDYMDEIGALLCFLNILQCANVHCERSKQKKGDKKIKGALQFDAYHVLTIDAPNGTGVNGAPGFHRSPREHLRRGHIRRLPGKSVWVNASIVGVNAGGKITKDYRLAS